MDKQQCLDMATAIINGNPPDDATYAELARMPEQNVLDMLPGADAIREHFFGRSVHLCCILNAKSGKCGEDCAFCAQSAYARTDAQIYPLMDSEEIRKGVQYAKANRIHRFSVVTSGGRLSGKAVARLAGAMASMSNTDVRFCASLGTLGATDFEVLKRAGITRYHHNLETAESHFEKICTSHAYADRVETIRAAKRSGMRVCAGGLFGIGESDEQVLELGMALRHLDVDAVPVNFLIPVSGTRLEKIPRISALRCLKIIALLRYLLFDKPIIVCAGRTTHLGRYHDRVFQAGASGIMTGNYLTAPGRNPSDDHAMIRGLGFVPCSGN
ncbi:Biotin synthase [Desulfosarcina cetonica]|uniref:biotin synthase BioB n=1 Tax=Desulfosarcina cetonica TaxID=90730 RepID=UPI0006D1A2EF|nr:biotin synthase BioB [Desulfosarcina cetonica]VTR69278.1 Biotin synthase [Desulfosarcina cetonica]